MPTVLERQMYVIARSALSTDQHSPVSLLPCPKCMLPLTIFPELADFELDDAEEISAVKSLSNSGISSSSAFCVGTLRTDVGSYEPTRGRLLLFELEGSSDLKLVAEEETDGCVYAIATANGMVVAAVNSSVRSIPSSSLSDVFTRVSLG